LNLLAQGKQLPCLVTPKSINRKDWSLIGNNALIICRIVLYKYTCIVHIKH